MNITATAVAVTLAVVIAVAFLFFGPNLFAPFTGAPGTVMEVATTTTTAMATSSNELSAPAPIQGPLPTTLSLSDQVVGTGEVAKPGDTVTVNYVGAFPDGTIFDASAKHGQAFSFKLGAHQVIAGWDEGVAGMKVGGRRLLVIPPDKAYGPNGVPGAIPPNATLIFEVELVSVSH